MSHALTGFRIPCIHKGSTHVQTSALSYPATAAHCLRYQHDIQVRSRQQIYLKSHVGTDYEMLLQLDQPRQGEVSQPPAATEEQLASIPSFTLHIKQVLPSQAGATYWIHNHRDINVLHRAWYLNSSWAVEFEHVCPALQR